jgi:hypothetical protein
MHIDTDQHVAERFTEDGDDFLDLTTIGLGEAVRQI